MKTGLPIHLGTVGEQVIAVLSEQFCNQTRDYAGVVKLENKSLLFSVSNLGKTREISTMNCSRKRPEWPNQNTHKTLSKMVQQKILDRQNRKYFLSRDWVNKILEFAQDLKNRLDY